MRPVRLQIEGLRSYRKAQTVEFERSGLLAITGSTGAGKSSILEAMMFALYGVYSGSSRTNKELIGDRSDEMRVSLEFEQAGQRYTARRAVSRKGPGSFALLRGEEVLSHDAHAMTAAVTELLGLDEEQFKKTIFLPQGAFQSFLTSKPKERVELLKRLLQFDSLDDMEGRVAEWLQDVRQRVDRAEGFRLQLPAQPAQLIEQRTQELAQAQQDWQKLDEQSRQLEGYRQGLSGLTSEADSVAQQLRLLDGFSDLQDWDGAGMLVLQAELQQGLDQAASALEQLDKQITQWSASTPEVSEADLRNARRDWERLQQSGRSLDELRADIAQRAARQEPLQARILELEQQRAPLAAQTSELEALLAEIQQRGESLRQSQSRFLAWQKELQAAESRLPELATELEAAVGERDAADQALAQARKAWREAELWRVCGQHQAGDDCPVCTRPLPWDWTPPQAPLSELELEQAELQAQQSHRLYERVSAAHALAAEQLQQLRSQELESSEAACLEAREEWTGKAEQLALLRRELHRGDGELATLQREGQDLTAQLQRQQQRASEQQEQHQQLTARVGELNDQRLTELEEAWQRHRHSGQQLQHARIQAAQQQQDSQRRWHLEVEQPLAQLEFLRARCVAALDLPSDTELEPLQQSLSQERQRLRDRARELQDALKQGEARLQTVLTGLGLADWRAFEARLEAGRAQQIRAQQGLEQALEQARQVEELEACLQPARVHLDRLQTLARLLGHQRAKGTRLTFPQWFLQQRQFELLELASQHLELLSGGQFRFEEDMDDAQAFRVLDLFSGVPRAVTTLSGGETFLASLSLAVALAELVGRRGGQLQALFLDEGFGTLSAECLDRALSALEQLAAQDRLIGIISHVPLIAERVEQVWVVRKGPEGSQITRADDNARRELVRQELANFDPRLHPLLTN